jgi:uncharacterized protein (UPF0303 family)
MVDTAKMLAAIRRQEARLVLKSFDVNVAFALGAALRDRALAEELHICIDIHTFDRQVFFWTMPNATAANATWCKRKSWVVRNRGWSSYRGLFENKGERLYGANWGLDPAVYALSGGAFPIIVKGSGVIGVMATSGLHERDDHQLVVDALCDHLKMNRKDFALPTD